MPGGGWVWGRGKRGGSTGAYPSSSSKYAIMLFTAGTRGRPSQIERTATARANAVASPSLYARAQSAELILAVAEMHPAKGPSPRASSKFASLDGNTSSVDESAAIWRA